MASIDSIYDAMQNKIDREMNLFNQEFESVMRTVELLAVQRGISSLKDPLQFDYAFQQILNEAGYYELVNKFVDDAYDKNYKDILAIFEEGGLSVAYSAEDLRAIQELKELDIQTFRDIGNQAAVALQKDLYKYSLSNMTTKDLANSISESLSGTDLAKYSKTYAETSISNYNQAIINMKAQDTEGVWVYVGVNDKKTRHFCKRTLSANKFYDDSEKSKLENDKARRWNCRHQFLKISKESAIEQGYKDA